MSEFWNLTFSGLVTGAIYGIMASGLVLTYSTSGIFNFAHGAVYMMGAFCAYFLLNLAGIGSWPALILAPIVLICMGALKTRETSLSRAWKGLSPMKKGVISRKTLASSVKGHQYKPCDQLRNFPCVC